MHHSRTTFFDEKGRALIPVNPSWHSMCAHSWKVFEIFLRPIVIFSEQALEHWNKHMAGFKSGCGTHSRQHSSKKNLYDILARMLWMTNPLVVKRRRQKKCRICGYLGHTTRSKLHHNAGGRLGQDDSLIVAHYPSSQ